jgi:membrane protease YdiL (CAAX protease family)
VERDEIHKLNISVNGRILMKVILKAFLVSFIIYLVSVTGFNFFGEIFPKFRTLGGGILVYVGRLILLFVGVFIFYTRNFFSVFSFLGMKKRFVKPFLAGFIPSLPFIFSWIGGCIAFDIPIRLSAHSLVMLFFAFIGPGLFEEGLFRGVLFKEILGVSKWYFAALCTGIFFGPAHLANLLVGHNISEVTISIVAGFIMSFPIGYMFFKMRANLWTCIFFHFFVAGSMDALISEELIKAHLGNITLVTTIGLFLSLVLVFILFGNKRYIAFFSGKRALN